MEESKDPYKYEHITKEYIEDILNDIVEKDIEKDAEEATIWCYKKKIRELLRNEERLSTLRVVYYILTK